MIESARFVHGSRTASRAESSQELRGMVYFHLLPVNSGGSIYLSRDLRHVKEVVDSLFLLAAFGAIVTVVICWRQISKLLTRSPNSMPSLLCGWR